MIEFEEYKLKLNDLKPKLEALAASLNLDRVRNELERFHAMQEAPGFWDDRTGLRKSWSRQSCWKPSWRNTTP